MECGTLVNFVNRHDQTMLMTVLHTDDNWSQCLYSTNQSGGLDEKVLHEGTLADIKVGWFLTARLAEAN